MDDEELVVIHSFRTRQEADVGLSALDAAGIDAIVRADTGGGVYRTIAWAGLGFQVLVRSEDADEARAILDLPARTVPEER
jgi:hypothetical protein